MEEKYVNDRIHNEVEHLMQAKITEINERKLKKSIYEPNNFLT